MPCFADGRREMEHLRASADQVPGLTKELSLGSHLGFMLKYMGWLCMAVGFGMHNHVKTRA